MRLWSIVLAVGLVGSVFASAAGCVGGPGDGFGEDAGSGLASGFGNGNGNGSTSSSSSSSSSTSGSSGATRTTIKASDFNQTCGTAADCVTVFQGDPCNPCPCPNAAIARADFEKYTSDISSARATCPRTDVQVDCAACPNAVAVCSSDKCTAAVGVTTPDGG